MPALSLVFDLLARDKGASKTLRDVGNEADGVGRKGGAAGAALGAGIKAGVAVSAAALAGFGAAAVVGVKSASNLAESINATNVVFGDQAGAIQKLGEEAARSLGMSNVEFNSTAVQFSNAAKKIAGDGGDVAGVIKDITGRATDFASVMNLDVAEANRVFQSAMAGETEPIRRFGIDMSAATVAAYAYKEGIAASGETLTEQQKTLARYGLLMESTAIVQGDFANTSDALANRQRILGATIEDLKARIGEALLPVAERLFGFLLDKGVPAVESLITGFEDGTGAGGRIRDALGWVIDKGTALHTWINEEGLPALRDLSAWVDEHVVPVLERMGQWIEEEGLPALQDFSEWVKTEVVPRLKDLQKFMDEKGLPALKTMGEYLEEKFTPTWEALVETYREDVEPALDRLKTAIDENRPALERVAKWVGTVMGALALLQIEIAGKVLPVLVDLVGYLIDTAVTTFEQTAEEVTMIMDAFDAAKDAVKWFWDQLTGVGSLPKWLEDLEDILNKMNTAFTSSGSSVRGWFAEAFGDAPGAFQGVRIGGSGAGGPALARVQSVLPDGLRITSTYRSPEHNARVGGSPTSKHMDKNNPAVDIAGPVALMDQFAETLRGMGGWRQLLYRVSGHFDHIHVAHAGGTVSSAWPRMPGDRPDERTARLQVGEEVVPRSEVGRGTGDTIIVNAPDVALRVYGVRIAQQVERERAQQRARRMAVVAP